MDWSTVPKIFSNEVVSNVTWGCCTIIGHTGPGGPGGPGGPCLPGCLGSLPFPGGPPSSGGPPSLGGLPLPGYPLPWLSSLIWWSSASFLVISSSSRISPILA